MQDRSLPCIHLGADTGETVNCPTCRGNIQVKVMQCSVYKECTIGKRVDGRQCCATCDKYEAKDMRTVSWACGVTTVPERREGVLVQTLESLKAAEFDKPRLFVDGHGTDYDKISREYGCTFRSPQIRAYGNWVLALYELYIREPTMQRYVIFQDDILLYRNLRQYLDKCKFPEKGYWNLYTVRQNQALAGRNGNPSQGWYNSNQMGKGALGLVFDRAGVVELLKAQHTVERPMSASSNRFHNIDGAVCEAMKRAGYKEWVHSPSLVQHVGAVSAIGNKHNSKQYAEAPEWRGQEFDALNLLSAEVAHVEEAAGEAASTVQAQT